MSRRAWAFATAGLVVVAMSAAAHAATSNVTIKDNVFIPDTVSIQPGDTVTWTNNGRSPHNVTYGDKSKASPTINPGGTYSITFSTAQTVYYYCSFHSSGPGKGMAGVIKVGSGGRSSARRRRCRPAGPAPGRGC
jgi:plastocyanin